MYNSAVLFLFGSNTIYIVMTCFILTLIIIANELNIKLLKKKLWSKSSVPKYAVVIDENNNGEVLKEAPGPKPRFIVGNLDVLDGYDVPYQAFNDLAEKYGSIIKLQLGSVPSMVINGMENIKEVLVHKGHHFDSRPNFRRYHMLFSGNKENCKWFTLALRLHGNLPERVLIPPFFAQLALAFCDWSDMHKTRREMLTAHTFPRKFSMSFNRLGDISLSYLAQLSVDVQRSMQERQVVSIKPLIQEACANIFTQYFTTRSFEHSDNKFQKLITNFDKIFYEVNQGYAADFLPFLLPLHRSNMKKMERWSHEIRNFILENIITDRFESWNVGDEPNDYIDSLIDHVKQNLQPRIDWEQALFALEDILGGHAAVANFVVKVLAYVTQHVEVQKNIQAEVDSVLSERSEKSVLIADRNKLIYTEAVIMESLRCVSSPIVPHVAQQNSSIDGKLIYNEKLL